MASKKKTASIAKQATGTTEEEIPGEILAVIAAAATRPLGPGTRRKSPAGLRLTGSVRLACLRSTVRQPA